MGSEDLTNLNERFYEEVFRRRNVNAIDDLLTDDFVEHIPAPGQDTGRQGAKDFIGQVLQAFPDLDIRIEEQIVQGDKIAAVVRMQGTHRGDFVGIPATGKKISVEVMDMGRVRGGKFCDHWGLADIGGLMAQLGVAPAAR
jgi:steroid delta-isomerase-like uncharacterized protein